MKKIFFAATLSALILMCACSNNTYTNDSTESSTYENSATISVTSNGTITYKDNAQEISYGNIIERTETEDEPSAPDGGISFDEAVEILDSCSFEALYLPQPTTSYEKFYCGTVSYNGTEYYSIDLYINSDNGKVFVGTNCLVSCDGSKVLIKTWTSDYISIEINSSSSDKNLNELYPNAGITPNEALLVFASLGTDALGLDEALSSYTFEVDTSIQEVKNIKCYRIMPKLNYENSIAISSYFYVTIDGSNRVFTADSENTGEYIEIK